MNNESILTENQTREYRVDTAESVVVVTVRYDDKCHNGHNTFSITGKEYWIDRIPGEAQIQHSDGRTMWLNRCGTCNDLVTLHFQDLMPLLKWHLCSSEEPMHYIANTVYHAGDKDHWGLRRGEFRQNRDKESGLLRWELSVPQERWCVASDQPPPVTCQWEPFGKMGEGKDRDLDAARDCAIWPEATDEDLTAPGLEERLLARLPALMAEFRAAVESLGFVW